jgi:hypothetical protein
MAMLRSRSTNNHSSQEAREPLLSDSETVSTSSGHTPSSLKSNDSKPEKMRFFDNLRNWDKSKRYRYVVLLVLSLSGDGWCV